MARTNKFGNSARRASGTGVMLEALERRQLLSAAVPTAAAAGIILDERAGVQFTADLGKFVTLAPGNNLEATINWGDGTTSAGVLKADRPVGLDEIKFEVDGTHTYAKAGTYAINAVVIQPSPTPTTVVRLVASFNDTAIVTGKKLALSGSVSGTYSLAPTAVGIGAEYVFNGSGALTGLGPVGAQGDVILPAFAAAGTASGTLTLTSASTTPADAGSVTLKLTGTVGSSGAFPSTLTYVITGGTGIFSGASGNGTIAVKLGTDPNSFTFLFSAGPTPVV